MCGYAVINLVGGGLIVQLPFTVGQVKAGQNSSRSVNTLLTTAQMFGLAVSLGTATTLFVNIAVPAISLLLPNSNRETVYALIEGVGSISFTALPQSVRSKVLSIVTRSVAKVFYILVAGGTLGLVTSFLLKWEKLVL